MKKQDEYLAMLESMNIVEDPMFQKVMEDVPATQEVIQILLNRENLTLEATEPQRYLRNVGTRSVVLDLLSWDADGRNYAIEMQRANDTDHQKRVRYIGSNLDTVAAEKGIPFEKIPEVYAIYLSEFDLFGCGRTVYHVDRILRETNGVVHNGFHELYVNTKVHDGSRIARLMQFMKDTTITEETRREFPHITARVRYLRENQEGVRLMRGVFQEYLEKKGEEIARETAKETARETARKLFANGVDYDLVRRSIDLLTDEELQTIYAETMDVVA